MKNDKLIPSLFEEELPKRGGNYVTIEEREKTENKERISSVRRNYQHQIDNLKRDLRCDCHDCNCDCDCHDCNC